MSAANKCKPTVAPLSDIPNAVQSLCQLTNSIQKQLSTPTTICGGRNSICWLHRSFRMTKVTSYAYFEERKNVEIGLDQIMGLILVFFIGNTSSLTDLGQECKWCPAGNTMGSTSCGITRITKAVSCCQVRQEARQFNSGDQIGMSAHGP